MTREEVMDELKNKIETSDQFKLVTDDSPGLYMGFESKGKILFEIKKGLTNVENGNKIDIDSIFLTASLTKPVLKDFFLELDIQDKKVCSFIKCDHPQLNIGHLLEHRSGLIDHLEYMNKDEFNKISLRELSNIILSKKIKFRPGQKREYCNSGYELLARIIEIVFKKEYQDVLRDYYKKKKIEFNFGPNSLKETPSHYISKKHFVEFERIHYRNKSLKFDFDTQHIRPWTVSSQYVFDKNKLIKIPINKYYCGYGDGSLISSPRQYLKFINTTNYKKILIKCESPYGVGYYHAGASTGVSTFFFHIEKYDLNVILFANFENYDYKCFPNCITETFSWHEY